MTTEDVKTKVKKKAEIQKSGNEKYKTVQDLIKRMEPEIKKALPEHIKPERIGRIALTEIRRNPKLLEASQMSLLGAIMTSAQLGLEPGPLGHAWLIPYHNKKTGNMEVQFQLGYRGLLELVRRSGEITSIHADVVCENDVFEFEYGVSEKLRHIPKLDGPRGKPYAAYATARFKDGGHAFMVMSEEQIMKRKKASKSPNYGPWVDWEEEMWKKTVLKAFSKYLPLSIEIQRDILADESTKKEIQEDMPEVPDETDWLEVEAEEVSDEALAQESNGKLFGDDAK